MGNRVHAHPSFQGRKVRAAKVAARAQSKKENVMTMQSVSLSALEASAANPRRKFDRKTIEGLAASIRTDGLLHNLVVSPIKGQKGRGGREKRFQIVSGGRRFAALQLLEQRGELPEDFTVAVEVRDDLSKDQTLRIATVENLQRQNMTPLEEAAALCKLVHKGVTLDDVVSQTGLSATTIKRRLALNNLCKESRQALSKGQINLAQAEALTLGSDEAQQRLLEQLADCDYSADDIRGLLLDDRPTVALAIFPPEDYTGTITTDLFAAKEESYFDDAEQFFALQKAAVAELYRQHLTTASWVKITEEYRIPEWQYRKAKTGEQSGVLINLSPSGHVEVREGLVPHRIEKQTAEALLENPVAPVKAKAAYSAPLCRYIAHHKTAAVAEVLLASPRTAQDVLTVQTLKSLRIHAAFAALAKESEWQSAYAVMETQAKTFAGKLGFAVEDGRTVWDCFPPYGVSELALYEAVRALSDHDLTQLQSLLAALSFGQENGDRLDTRDSLFNRVARDLSVDMKNHWRPDAAFFAKRNREQLVGIAKECGYADGNGSLGSYKKAELVSSLIRHFQNAFLASDPTPSQQKARSWLPEAMLFPAVDRDAPASTEDEAEAADDGAGED
jgi:ParB family chromosome partitioning protein